MSDKAESEYKDDPKAFAQSSDLATRGETGEYAGGGVDDSSANFTPAKGEQAWQKAGVESSQEGADKPDAKPDAKHDDEKVESRSADSGQSSYGGFKNEGPADNSSGDK